jgi:Zn-dependent protease
MTYIIILVPILMFSVILHEVAHGWVAERFGDDTARVMGRLTFNPIPHIDIVGTLVLPALCIITHAPIFGWAKPVPVNPYRLNNPKKDMLWVGLAGPASNVALALVAAAAMWAIRSYPVLPAGLASSMHDLFFLVLELNVILCIFNLIPVPPLDGSRVVMALLPPELGYRYAQLENYGIIIVLVLFSTGIITALMGPIVNFVIFYLSGGRILF